LTSKGFRFGELFSDGSVMNRGNPKKADESSSRIEKIEKTLMRHITQLGSIGRAEVKNQG